MTYSHDYAPRKWQCVAVRPLDGCNAYIRVLKHDSINGLQVQELVSFCTPICVAIFAGHTLTSFYANGAATCSASSKRHFRRFAQSIKLNSNDIERAIALCGAVPYDNFLWFEIEPGKNESYYIERCKFERFGMLPTSETIEHKNGNGTIQCRMYVPRFGFYGKNDYWVSGGSEVGFKCFKAN